jgi:hypothetical protein
MTCIAGIAKDGIVHMSGDSAACSDWDVRVEAGSKVFQNGAFLIGYTTSFRMGQVLRYAAGFTEPTPGRNLTEFMVSTFITEVMTALKLNGVTTVDKGRAVGGQFLVGVNGHLFAIESDFSVLENPSGEMAVGVGADYAMGSMFSTRGLIDDPKKRLEIALAAASTFSMGVRPPVNTVSTKEEEKPKETT